jgi:hypothetical protein
MQGAWFPQDRSDTLFIPALAIVQNLRGDRLPFAAGKGNPSQRFDAGFGATLLICRFRRVCTDTGVESAGGVLTNGGARRPVVQTAKTG